MENMNTHLLMKIEHFSFIFFTFAHLNLSEDALVEFIQVLYMPNQKRSISGMDSKQHIWALVPLGNQCLHLPLEQHGGQRHAGARSGGGRFGASLLS